MITKQVYTIGNCLDIMLQMPSDSVDLTLPAALIYAEFLDRRTTYLLNETDMARHSFSLDFCLAIR